MAAVGAAVFLAASAAPNITIPRACLPPHDKYPFCDPSVPMAKRVDDLISRLTLEEKPYLMVARESPKGNISRLGIPEYDWGGNCIHGVQSRCTVDGVCPTSFPNPNALGATFNRSVWKGMGQVIGLELRALWLMGVGENHDNNLPHIGLDCWSPNINLVRDPRWGRNLETPGEDPAVLGEFGASITTGLQNGTLDPRFLQAIVTLKHFDANSLEGPWGPLGVITRHTDNAKISMYDLHSSYLASFRTSVKKANALGVMCSYNAINGVPSCANSYLLNDVLRKDWGFKGYVTSDSGAVLDVIDYHHYTSTWKSTVATTVKAGCDIESAGWSTPPGPWATGGPYIDYIPSAVKAGLMSESDVDEALRHSLGLRFQLGLFDPVEDQPYWAVPPSVVRSADHVARAVDASAQSLVLLKNDAGRGLPFTAGKKVAVVGPHALTRGTLLGNYLGQICPDKTYNCVENICESVTKLNGKAGGTTVCVDGIGVNDTNVTGAEDALKAVQDADFTIFVGGINTTIEREGHDRHDVGLPPPQIDLLKRMTAVGKPLAVVLVHGGIVTMETAFVATLPAVVSVGYPGFFGAAAIADHLLATPGGQASNRWGKLAVTWYSTEGWAEANYDMLDFNMAAGVGRTYRYYNGTGLLWPFGYGLSYSKHALTAKASGSKVTATVSSADRQDADEVVIVFAKARPGVIPSGAPAARLQRQVVDFARVGPVAPTASATFEITPESLQLFNEQGVQTNYPGDYDITVSIGSADPVTLRFTCTATSCVSA
eukprot:TRINITY_DN603_c0_g1_i1.p1 TRINITY_DN603_c0_g1~~TRINITY_DN603_c0_g1_i1.p1  ORF type:complete len:790 (+),score=175.63 TRINITY_DN603_c0_g1_i1:58-2370(+)